MQWHGTVQMKISKALWLVNTAGMKSDGVCFDTLAQAE